MRSDAGRLQTYVACAKTSCTFYRIEPERGPKATIVKNDRSSRPSSARDTSRGRSDQLLAALVAAIRDTGANDERSAIRFVELVDGALADLDHLHHQQQT